MDSAKQGIFLCPSCGSAVTTVRAGLAECGSCGAKFGVPDSKKSSSSLPNVSTGSKPSPVASSPSEPAEPRAASPAASRAQVPQGSRSGSLGGGAVKRNINPRKAGGHFPLESARQKESSTADSDASRNTEEKQQKEGSSLNEGEPSGERRRRKKRRSHSAPSRTVGSYVKIGIAWLGVVIFLFFAALQVQKYFGGNARSNMTLEQRLSGEEKAFYRAEYPLIRKQFLAFLASRTNEGKAEIALDVPMLGRMMRRYYIDNQDEGFAPQMKQEPIFWNVAFEEKPGFVEAVFDLGGSELVETVFVKEGDTWFLDWEHFVRYSTQNWTLFRQQVGNDEGGVFRLYVEKVSESQEGEDSWVKIRFYGAHDEENRREVERSPVLMLKGDDPLLQQIEYLFSDREGESAGFSQLWKRDPRGLRRATVRLAWSVDPSNGEDILVLKEVLSHHWRTRAELKKGNEDSATSATTNEVTDEQ